VQLISIDSVFGEQDVFSSWVPYKLWIPIDTGFDVGSFKACGFPTSNSRWVHHNNEKSFYILKKVCFLNLVKK